MLEKVKEDKNKHQLKQINTANISREDEDGVWLVRQFFRLVHWSNLPPPKTNILPVRKNEVSVNVGLGEG